MRFFKKRKPDPEFEKAKRAADMAKETADRAQDALDRLLSKTLRDIQEGEAGDA